jgi:hypothetical protein
MQRSIATLCLALAVSPLVATDLDSSQMRLFDESILPYPSANYLGLIDSRYTYAEQTPWTDVMVTSGVDVKSSAAVAVRFMWTATSVADSANTVTTSMLVPTDSTLPTDQFQPAIGVGTLQIFTLGEWDVALTAVALIDSRGHEGVYSVSDPNNPFGIRVVTVAPPAEDPIVTLAMTGPALLGLPLDAALLPRLSFVDPTPSASYDVTWTFDQPVSIAGTASTSMVVTNGVAPMMVDGAQVIVFPAELGLTFHTLGTYGMSATVMEGANAFDAASASVTVNDPAAWHMDGKGSFDVGGKKSATFHLQVAFSDGAFQGFVRLTSKSQGLDFDSSSIADVLISGGNGSCSGTGRLNHRAGYSYTLAVVDGAPDLFSLIIRDPQGGVVYSSGGRTVAGRQGHIIVSDGMAASN